MSEKTNPISHILGGNSGNNPPISKEDTTTFSTLLRTPLNFSNLLADEAVKKSISIESLPSYTKIKGASKQDIRIVPVDDRYSKDAKYARIMRREQMTEEQGFDKNHTCYFSDERCIDFNKIDNFIELMGYINNIPVAYAGFEICLPCKIFLWRFFYIPTPLRKFSLSLPFARKIVDYFSQKIGPDVKLEITWHKDNRTMDMICRYLGVYVLSKL